MEPKDITPFEKSDLFGGSGTVRIWSLIQRQLPRFSAVLWCELEPGGHVGRHVQQEASEIVVVLEGEGTAHVSGKPQTLQPGSVVSLPLGDQLELRNTSTSEPMRYLIVKARG